MRQVRSIGRSWLEKPGRVGWFAKGVVYVLIGALAVPIAVGGSPSPDNRASRTGAIGIIAENSLGGVLLVLIAMGLVVYSLWRVTTAIMPGDASDPVVWARRVGYLMSASAYAFLAWSAVSFLTSDPGDQESGGMSTLEKVTRTLMGSTGGRLVLGVGGLGGLIVAGFHGHRALTRKFMDDIDMSSASEGEQALITGLGAAGWIGRAMAIALLSFFVIEAAWTASPTEARGLDEALRDTAHMWWGAVLVLVAGVTLAAYGSFAIISARRRRLVGP
jgi:hypothetical protein